MKTCLSEGQRRANILYRKKMSRERKGECANPEQSCIEHLGHDVSNDGTCNSFRDRGSSRSRTFKAYVRLLLARACNTFPKDPSPMNWLSLKSVASNFSPTHFEPDSKKFSASLKSWVIDCNRRSTSSMCVSSGLGHSQLLSSAHEPRASSRRCGNIHIGFVVLQILYLYNSSRPTEPFSVFRKGIFPARGACTSGANFTCQRTICTWYFVSILVLYMSKTYINFLSGSVAGKCFMLFFFFFFCK